MTPARHPLAAPTACPTLLLTGGAGPGSGALIHPPLPTEHPQGDPIFKRTAVLALAGALSAPLLTTVTAAPASAASTCVRPWTPTDVARPSTEPDPNMPTVVPTPPAPGQPDWDGQDRLYDMALVGRTVYAVGAHFDQVSQGGQTYTRHNAFAFDAITGALTDWAPDITGEVRTVAASCTGGYLYLGGDLGSVNGTVRAHGAKVDAGAGTSTASWDPQTDATINEINLVGSHVLIGGKFTHVRGATRALLASVNATTGVPDTWANIAFAGHEPVDAETDSPFSVQKMAVAYDQSFVVVTGNFNTIGGVYHRRIAFLNPNTTPMTVYGWSTPLVAMGSANPWGSNQGSDCGSTHPAPEQGVTTTPNDAAVYLGDTGGPHAGSICDAVSAFSTTNLSTHKAAPMWQDLSGGDSFSGVACAVKWCMAAGHFRCHGFTPGDPANANDCPAYTWKSDGLVVFGAGHYYPSATTSRQRSMDAGFLLTPWRLFNYGDVNQYDGADRNDMAGFAYVG